MAFDETTVMEDMTDDGANEQEVAAPATETTENSVEDQEVAAPESEEPEQSGKTAADAAFAKMRRRAEEAERQAAERAAELESLRAQQAAREAALANMDIDEIDAIAEAAGISREEVLANLEREQDAAEAEIESREKDETIRALQDRIDEVEAEKAMAEDLAVLQRIDPGLKSLDDLGDDFIAYIGAGLTAEQAYYAVKGKDIATRSTPAKLPGKIADTSAPEKDYFTEEEVDNMTPAEQRKHHKKIIASMKHW